MFQDPSDTKNPTSMVTGPVGHLMAERIVAGLNDPKRYVIMIRTLLEYGVDKPKTQADAGADGAKKQIPRMIFLNEPRDSFAKLGDPLKPLRIPGQVAGPNGEIVDARTVKVMVPAAPGKSIAGDDGFGEREDRLELVEDTADYL